MRCIKTWPPRRAKRGRPSRGLRELSASYPRPLPRGLGDQGACDRAKTSMYSIGETASHRHLEIGAIHFDMGPKWDARPREAQPRSAGLPFPSNQRQETSTDGMIHP